MISRTALDIEFASQTRDRVRRYWFVPMIIGAIVVLTWARIQGWPDTIHSRDIYQHRANTGTVIPSGQVEARQTFAPTRNNLYEVELILWRGNEDYETDNGEITLTLWVEAEGRIVTSETFATRDLRHNQLFHLQFEAEPNSADTTYLLQITGQNNTSVAFWGYDLPFDRSHPIQQNGASDAVTLRLLTRYAVTPTLAVEMAVVEVGEALGPVGMTLLFLMMPGLLVVLAASRSNIRLVQSKDPGVHFTLALVLGLVIWPLLWIWLTAIGGRWIPVAFWGMLFVGYIAIITMALSWTFERLVVERSGEEWNAFFGRLSWHHGVLFFLIVLSLIIRLLAVRDLEFPAWVDASRHALITAVMVESRTTIQNYGSFLNVPQIPLYHFGFHAVPASLVLMTESWAPKLLLIIGQLYNALMPLCAYAGASMLTKRRGAGLLAAFLIGLPFFFPAYYVSWGRLTQLTGMLVMGLLLATTWELAQSVRRRRFGSAETRQSTIRDYIIKALPTALLASGLLLIHFRVFLLYIPYALVVWLMHIRLGRPRQLGLLLPVAGVLTAILSAPRLLEMAQRLETEASTVFASSAGYNSFPTGYITAGWEQYFLYLVAGSLLIAIVRILDTQEWLNWIMSAGFLTWVAAGEWLGSVPMLFNLNFLRTGLLAILLVLNLNNLRSRSFHWIFVMTLWLSLEHFLIDLRQQFIVTVCLVVLVWLAPRLDETNWVRQMTALSLWVGALFLLLLGDRVGLPESWVININSMYITLFLPIALVICLAYGPIWDWIAYQFWLTQLIIYIAFGVALTGAGLFGVHTQINILNEGTILAHSADATALTWLDDNIPQDAKVAVGSWKWLGATWTGQDGGAWIVPMTGRESTTPPADYIYNLDLIEPVETFNQAANDIEDWSAEEAVDFLKQHDVTHVYIGVKGGYIDPGQLAKNPGATLIYAHQGAFIFEVP